MFYVDVRAGADACLWWMRCLVSEHSQTRLLREIHKSQIGLQVLFDVEGRLNM